MQVTSKFLPSRLKLMALDRLKLVRRPAEGTGNM